MIQFFHRSHAKKARIWTSFWLARKKNGWFVLFRLAKMPPSISCCWFQSAFLLSSEYTHEFCRLWQFSWILKMSKFLWIVSIEIFSISSYTKKLQSKIHRSLNAIWYQVQVTEATNRFTFQIMNGLTVIPPSETCELFWAIFAFVTLFSSWNMVYQLKKIFSLLSLAQKRTKSTNFYQ